MIPRDDHTLLRLAEKYDTPTLLLSTEAVANAYRALQNALPEVDFFYAVKANDNPELLRTWLEAGGGFDLASYEEIEQVQAMGVHPHRCIYTHPIKSPDTVQRVWKAGIQTMVVDNPTELTKLLPLGSELRLLIRMAIPNQQAVSNLSVKFGILEEAELLDLFRQAHRGGIHQLGLCFHCGSPTDSPEVVRQALLRSQRILKRLAQEGIAVQVLDLGGGFPLYPEEQATKMQRYAQHFKQELRWFSDQGIALIAEPGRFVSGPAMTLLTQVIGVAHREGKPWYYLDDGVYNSLAGQVFEKATYPVRLLTPRQGQAVPSVLAGPTCDSVDVMATAIPLPPLQLGDVLAFTDIGAYSSACATNFHGLPKTHIIALSALTP